MIDGVIVKRLTRFPDDRGSIMKMMQASDEEFKGFGEIYFSTIYPGVVKGWHLHKNATVNLNTLKGMVKLVIFDNRENSPTKGEFQEIYFGDDNYVLVQIPEKLWMGLKCIGTQVALIADLITVVHEDDVREMMDPHNNGVIQYDWSIKEK